MRKYLTPSICFLVLAVLMTPEAWHLERPVTLDHAVHYAKVWQMLDRGFPDGIYWGWSHSWMDGYPVGYLYPVFADWLVATIYGICRLLSFGHLPLGFAYTLAVILTHFLEGHSLYFLGRTMGMRGAGFLAGLVFMTQAGKPFVGGWHWTHYVGVWPVALSVSLAIYGCAAFWRLTRQPGPRAAGVLGLVWGAALMAHPLQMIHLLAMFPAMLIAILWRCESGRASIARWLVAGTTIAAGIGCLWILPFVLVNQYAERDFFVQWKPLAVLLGEMMKGQIFDGLLPAMQIAGLAGVVVALRRGNPVMASIALGCILLIVTGSTTFYDAFRLGEISPAFRQVQYIRFQAMIRPYWCLAGAVFLLHFAQGLFRRHGALIVMMLFMLASLPDAANSLFVKRVFHPWLRRHADYEGVVTWLRGVESADTRFFRVAVFNEPEHPFAHELPELITRVRSPVLAANYHPSVNFGTAGRRQNQETIKMLGIRFLISERADPDVLRDVAWQLRQRFGRYFVYENSVWEDKRVSWRDLNGWSGDPGLIREVSWGTGMLSAGVSPGVSGTVLFHTAYFPRWRATWTQMDGATREVEARPLRLTSDVEVIAVPIPDAGGGRVDLKFHMAWPEWLAIIVFCLAFAVALIFVFRPGVKAAAR